MDQFSEVEGGFGRPWERVYTCPHCGEVFARVPATEDEVEGHMAKLSRTIQRLEQEAEGDDGHD